jgi:hypothetical protein
LNRFLAVEGDAMARGHDIPFELSRKEFHILLFGVIVLIRIFQVYYSNELRRGKYA